VKVQKKKSDCRVYKQKPDCLWLF